MLKRKTKISFSFVNYRSSRLEVFCKKGVLWDWFFPVNFVKFLRTPFLTEQHLCWLLLELIA